MPRQRVSRSPRAARNGFRGSALDARRASRCSAGLQARAGRWGQRPSPPATSSSAATAATSSWASGGDDIIDGDKWLERAASACSRNDADRYRHCRSHSHNSMTTLAAAMFAGTINPGQLGSSVKSRTDATSGDIDIAVLPGRSLGIRLLGHRGRAGDRHACHRGLARRHRPAAQHRTAAVPATAARSTSSSARPATIASTARPQDDLILGLGGATCSTAVPATTSSSAARGTDSTATLCRQLRQPSAATTTPALTSWAAAWVETGDNGNINSSSQGQIRIDNGNSNTLQFRDDDSDTGNGHGIDPAHRQSCGRHDRHDQLRLQRGQLRCGRERSLVEFSPTGVDPFQTDQHNQRCIRSRQRSSDFVLNGPFTATAAIRFIGQRHQQ